MVVEHLNAKETSEFENHIDGLLSHAIENTRKQLIGVLQDEDGSSIDAKRYRKWGPRSLKWMNKSELQYAKDAYVFEKDLLEQYREVFVSLGYTTLTRVPSIYSLELKIKNPDTQPYVSLLEEVRKLEKMYNTYGVPRYKSRKGFNFDQLIAKIDGAVREIEKAQSSGNEVKDDQSDQGSEQVLEADETPKENIDRVFGELFEILGIQEDGKKYLLRLIHGRKDNGELTFGELKSPQINISEMDSTKKWWTLKDIRNLLKSMGVYGQNLLANFIENKISDYYAKEKYRESILNPSGTNLPGNGSKKIVKYQIAELVSEENENIENINRVFGELFDILGIDEDRKEYLLKVIRGRNKNGALKYEELKSPFIEIKEMDDSDRWKLSDIKKLLVNMGINIHLATNLPYIIYSSRSEPRAKQTYKEKIRREQDSVHI